MARYTVIVIDHDNKNKAKILEINNLDELVFTKEKTEVVKTPFSTNTIVVEEQPTRVIPNYESVASLLSSETKHVGNNKGSSKIADRLTNRFIKEEKAIKEKRSPLEMFEERLEKEQYDKFNSHDLVYFFRHTAEKAKIKVAINWQRDSKHAKLAKENLSIMDIIAMIEFLFLSKQKYLEKRSLSISILNTGWMNRIYQDTQDWLEDKYVPTNNNEKPKKAREWSEEKPTKGTDVKVGWGD